MTAKEMFIILDYCRTEFAGGRDNAVIVVNLAVDGEILVYPISYKSLEVCWKATEYHFKALKASAGKN